MSALGPFIVENSITHNSSLLLQITTSEWWPKEHWIRMNFLCNDLYSSSLFYCLVVFSAHTGNKGDLDLRQLFLIIKKQKRVRLTYLNLNVPHMTHSTLSKSFFNLKVNVFFFEISHPLEFILNRLWLTTCHFFKRKKNWFCFVFLKKNKILSGVRLD